MRLSIVITANSLCGGFENDDVVVVSTGLTDAQVNIVET